MLDDNSLGPKFEKKKKKKDCPESKYKTVHIHVSRIKYKRALKIHTLL